MAESRGPLENILSNLQTTTELLRVQAVRADQVITRTMDRLDRASTTVNAVVTPARQISGIFQGVSVGIDAFLRSRQRRRLTMAVSSARGFRGDCRFSWSSGARGGRARERSAR